MKFKQMVLTCMIIAVFTLMFAGSGCVKDLATNKTASDNDVTPTISERSSHYLLRAIVFRVYDSENNPVDGAEIIITANYPKVNSIFDSISEALVDGDRVEIRGFGSFTVRERDSRDARNPKSGELVKIPAKKTPFFKTGKELRERVDA